MNRFLLILLVIIIALPSCKKDNDPGCNFEDQKINELQFLASHNSYRIKTYQPIFDYVISLYDLGVIPDGLNPNEWDYTHLSLPEQLEDYNVRSFEIDIYPDPDGGLFYNRAGNGFVLESTESGIPELLEPGYKVMHIPDLDYNTHYYTFKQTLNTLNDWSNANPSHEPIFVMLELKTETAADFLPGLGFAPALPYTSENMEDLENEIKDVYGQNLDGVYTPDMLKGNYSTVEEAVLNDNWPTLRDARGHIFFIMSFNDEAKSNYLNGHPGLQDRAMFYFASQGEDAAAFVKMDDPIGGMSNIQQAVNDGYFIRTRSDSGTTQARDGNTERREAAFASGAQIISTDYYKADARAETSNDWTDYSVQFSNGTAFQLNTVNNDSPACPE